MTRSDPGIIMRRMNGSEAIELYIHIPFCVRKCGYCDFLSFSAGEELQRQYADALIRELRSAGKMLGNNGKRAVGSVFYGGGTPSLLPPDLIRSIQDEIEGQFATAPDAEISIEVNPGTVTPEKLRQLREAGFNRVSIGCQSVHDTELAALGRIHTYREFRTCLDGVRDAGFDNVNVDLMYGIPGQTEASWEQTLRTAAGLGVQHISAYSLILEEGTPFYDRQDTLALPDEESERRMAEMTAEILASYGLRQYEISNYAQQGYACRHNTGYWTGVPYLGAGLGASSYLPAGACLRTGLVMPRRGAEGGADATDPQGDTRMFRLRNTDSLSDYLRNSGTARVRSVTETLEKEDLQAEFMILGLRMTDGVSKEDYLSRFGEPVEARFGGVLDRHLRSGLLSESGGRIALTRRGLSLANVVMRDLL